MVGDEQRNAFDLTVEGNAHFIRESQPSDVAGRTIADPGTSYGYRSPDNETKCQSRSARCQGRAALTATHCAGLAI